jgi:hypothetical protein
MHQEHRSWETDINCWRDDVACWQREIREALARVQQLEKELEIHESNLCQHASSIRLDELEIATHEHALANAQGSGDQTDLPVYAAQHMKEKSRHEHQLMRHREFKQQHHAFIANWNRMLKSLHSLGTSEHKH